MKGTNVTKGKSAEQHRVRTFARRLRFGPLRKAKLMGSACCEPAWEEVGCGGPSWPGEIDELDVGCDGGDCWSMVADDDERREQEMGRSREWGKAKGKGSGVWVVFKWDSTGASFNYSSMRSIGTPTLDAAHFPAPFWRIYKAPAANRTRFHVCGLPYMVIPTALCLR